ncbi:MAG: hypothetical protein AB1Z98_18015, partial [Nannocystaceae bacterium]
MVGSSLLLALLAVAPDVGVPDDPAAPTDEAPVSEAPEDPDPEATALDEAPPSDLDGESTEPDLEPAERAYEGPTAVESPPDELETEAPEPAPSESPTAIEPEPEPVYIDEPVPPPAVIPPVVELHPIPRALSTMFGNPPSETATIVRGRLRFEPGVQLRNQVGWVSSFPLDRLGNAYDEGALSTGRLRWNPRLGWGRVVSVTGMLDLINGRWAPAGSDDPLIDEIIEQGQPPGRTELRLVDPRELYVDLNTPLGLLRAGQQSFTWGQGMLANNGNVLDRFGDLRFGDDGPGDIYERVLFITKPFKYRPGRIKNLAIGIGGDLVFRDERVQLTRGDRA